MRQHGFLGVVALIALGCGPSAPVHAPQPTSIASSKLASNGLAEPPKASTELEWNGSEVVFATVDEARALLGTSDEFTRTMGDFDRSVRFGADRKLSEQAFLEYAAQQARAWPAETLPRWRGAVVAIAAAMKGLGLQFPSRVSLIVSTGKEELDAAYTRGNAIVIPLAIATRDADPFALIAHEMFHVASRHNPGIRDPLYGLLGFRRVARVSYPDEIAARRITNPDAISFEHAIRVQRKADDVALDVVALFYSKKSLSEAISAGLMASLALELVELPAAGTNVKPRIIPVATTDYLARASINTEYAIHPEETLADNFALLLKRRAKRAFAAPRQDVLDGIEAELAKQ